ncbi:hypothetical protein [cyanobacterium endosymbiont of Rhopalodia gibberula]|uniref:hypothetical protein n=1 Tax=cyanobacterium endosymbiont of Rhopalodia gibberula TaxID=1763363 RepID=UPI001559CA90|nr:hypothetical protein [cyanobacterium endosymbiont of Rhopalodia gibberula]
MWQTETGGIMIAVLLGAISIEPGSATPPYFPGIVADVLNKADNTVSDNIG